MRIDHGGRALMRCIVTFILIYNFWDSVIAWQQLETINTLWSLIPLCSEKNNATPQMMYCEQHGKNIKIYRSLLHDWEQLLLIIVLYRCHTVSSIVLSVENKTPQTHRLTSLNSTKILFSIKISLPFSIRTIASPLISMVTKGTEVCTSTSLPDVLNCCIRWLFGIRYRHSRSRWSFYLGMVSLMQSLDVFWSHH